MGKDDLITAPPPTGQRTITRPARIKVFTGITLPGDINQVDNSAYFFFNFSASARYHKFRIEKSGFAPLIPKFLNNLQKAIDIHISI